MCRLYKLLQKLLLKSNANTDKLTYMFGSLFYYINRSTWTKAEGKY